MPDSSNPSFGFTSPETIPDNNPLPDLEPTRSGTSHADQLVAELADYQIHKHRYRRILRFALWLLIRVIAWEVVIKRFLGDPVVTMGRSSRMKQWAAEFSALAVDLGGVMIKLGQFISSRMDILPQTVIQELSRLQDEVPHVPFAQIEQTLKEEFSSLDPHFTSFETEPIAAASFGQAHRARLSGGEKVVVKVQRPGIRSLVHTDLKALSVIAGWLMKFPFIAHRANVPALLDEFSAVLWEELNYTLEATNVETFERAFANHPGVYIPHLYREHSTRRVLTLEDVSAIKITDYAAIEAVGIDRRDVSRRMMQSYFQMVFVERVFHADPHPGNLFVYPIPPDAPAGNGIHGTDQPMNGKPFYLIFIDFGMVGRLTPEIVDGLRETLVAMTTRDAHRLVQSYQRLGILLPGADHSRIETATRSVFDRVWGMNMSQLSGMQFSEMKSLSREFSDLLFSMPFQVPQDFLYLARAGAILFGMCTGLDPALDPWREMSPFVQEMLSEQGEAPGLRAAMLATDPRELLKPQTLRALLSNGGIKVLTETGTDMARRMFQLPLVMDEVLRQANRGELSFQITASPELNRELRKIEKAMQRVVGAVMFAGLAFSSALLYSVGEHTLSWIGMILTVLTFLRVVLAINAR